MARRCVNTLLIVLAGLGAAVALMVVLNPPSSATAAGPILYVAPSGSDTGNCTNSAAPCATIQYAVDRADAGAEIRVASGTYTGVNTHGGLRQIVYLSKTITLRGGYAPTDWSVAYPLTQVTTWDAAEQGRVVYVTGSISPVIEGLHLARGNASGLGGSQGNDAGGGTYVLSATVLLRDVWIYSGTAVVGGGLYAEDADVTLLAARVMSNTSNVGGGLFVDRGRVTVTDTVVVSNRNIGLHLSLSIASVVSSTFAFNQSSYGAGIVLDRSIADLSGNLFTGNTGMYAGGIYVIHSTATLASNVFVSNAVTAYGGGLAVEYGSITLTHNVIMSNSAWEAGGLYLGVQGAKILSNTFAANTASYHAGGVYGATVDDVTFMGNWFLSNIAGESGGGVWMSGYNTLLKDNVFSRNSARLRGGGLFAEGRFTLDGNTFYSNTSSYGGGLLVWSFGGSSLVNNIVANNEATLFGSGMHLEGPIDVLHTTVARNRGGDGSGVVLFGSATLTNTILVSQTVGITVGASSTARLEATLWGADAWANGVDWGGPGTIITGTLNLWGDPDFVDPGAGNYHIGANSAARDAGVDASVTSDIDGEPRPYAGGFDIGADELWPALSVAQQAWPDPVESGSPLTYTLRVTNTGPLTLTTTITDILPGQVTPTGVLTWTPVIAAPGGMWTQHVVVAAIPGYSGTLTNTLHVATLEGAAGSHSVTSLAVIPAYRVYLPLLLRQ